MTDRVTKAVRASGQYRDKTELGNKIHINIAKEVKALDDRNFIQELLLDPTGGKANPQKKGNVRLDLLENVESTQTVCVYDFKTGEAGLSLARAIQLAKAAHKNFAPIRRLIIIQLRPQI